MKWTVILNVLLLLTSCSTATVQIPTPVKTAPPDTAITNPPENERSTSEPMENPFAPQPDDTQLERGEVFLEESGLLIRESFPPQVSLQISGNLPTPCHQLRAEVSAPSADHKINVSVYTVVDPNLMCTQVLKPFSGAIRLPTVPSGHYSVWVNGVSVGEFDA